MIDELKIMLRNEVKRRKLSTKDLARMSGVNQRLIQRALSFNDLYGASLYVYEELFHTLGLRLQKVAKRNEIL